MDRGKLTNDYLFYCEIERGFSVHTVEAYRSDLEDFFQHVRPIPLEASLSVNTLKIYLSDMLKKRGLSVATARRRLASLRGFCRYVAQQVTFDDPFNSWSPSLKRPQKLPRALNRSTVGQLVEVSVNAPQIETETIFCVLLLGATGLRVSELCGILVQDVAIDGTAIHTKGKGAKDRVVYIGNKCLAAEIAERRETRLAEAGSGAPLLINKRGNVLKPQTVRRRMHKVVAARGLDAPITPHQLRHTAATMLLENGADVRFVQRQLGHASISTTEVYTHVTDAALKRAISQADPMNGFVWPSTD